jgi:hypothetical protein
MKAEAFAMPVPCTEARRYTASKGKTKSMFNRQALGAFVVTLALPAYADARWNSCTGLTNISTNIRKRSTRFGNLVGVM